MMMDAKKQALMNMKDMLKGAKANKMKVMVAGSNPEAVKEGLDKAEDVVEEMPTQPMKGPEMKVKSLVDGLSPEEKMAAYKMLMAEMGGEKEEFEDEMSC